jgi:hypothetical protein
MQTLPQLDVLFDSARVGLRMGLPAALERAYGSDLWLPPECVVANFVESVDGAARPRIDSSWACCGRARTRC